MSTAAAKKKPPQAPAGGLRLGLCCQFAREPIKFRTTTATAMLRLDKRERLARIAGRCRHNAEALMAALEFCLRRGIGADTINIHGGGGYGDKAAALRALRVNIKRLPAPVRSRLTLENDDKVYTPADLLPVCGDTGVPLVYDVHHHRCRPDGLSVDEATERARAAWEREPLFHLSSPLAGWRGPKPERHHDYIDSDDFPQAWRGLALTVEVEAKAKELAVARLQRDLEGAT